MSSIHLNNNITGEDMKKVIWLDYFLDFWLYKVTCVLWGTIDVK